MATGTDGKDTEKEAVSILTAAYIVDKQRLSMLWGKMFKANRDHCPQSYLSKDELISSLFPFPPSIDCGREKSLKEQNLFSNPQSQKQECAGTSHMFPLG